MVLPSRSYCSFGHRRATPCTPVEADTALYRSWHIHLFNQTASSCKARGTLTQPLGTGLATYKAHDYGQDTNFPEPWRPLLKNAGTVSHKHYSCNGQRPHVHSTMPGMWCPWNEYELPPSQGQARPPSHSLNTGNVPSPQRFPSLSSGEHRHGVRKKAPRAPHCSAPPTPLLLSSSGPEPQLPLQPLLEGPRPVSSKHILCADNPQSASPSNPLRNRTSASDFTGPQLSP